MEFGFYRFQPLCHYLLVPSLSFRNDCFLITVVHLLNALLHKLEVRSHWGRSIVGAVPRLAGRATDKVALPGIARASMAVVRALQLITYRNSR